MITPVLINRIQWRTYIIFTITNVSPYLTILHANGALTANAVIGMFRRRRLLLLSRNIQHLSGGHRQDFPTSGNARVRLTP